MSKGSAGSPLAHKRVLITSGPTREHLDPVRFLTNASSGRMGWALAREARSLGARVTVVSGLAEHAAPAGIRVLPVVSALQMRREVLRAFPSADVVIGAAAVGDWRFAERSPRKIKRSRRPLRVTLLPNPDILAELGARRRRSPALRRKVLVGFALETERWIERAREKLQRKRLDLVVANGSESLGGDRTRIALVEAKGRPRMLPPMSKSRAARVILSRVVSLVGSREQP